MTVNKLELQMDEGTNKPFWYTYRADPPYNQSHQTAWRCNATGGLETIATISVSLMPTYPKYL